MVKAVIFDFDGTFADIAPVVYKIVNDLARKYGYDRFEDYEEALELVKSKGTKRFIIENLGLNLFKLPSFVRDLKNEIYIRSEKDGKLFEGLEKFLEKLSNDYTIGILTSNSKDVVEFLLGDSKKHVKFIYPECSFFKKHKHMKKLLKQRKLKREDVVYVGDEARDIKASRKAKIKVIGVSWGYNAKDLLKKEKPDAIVDSFDELYSTIKKFN